MKRIAICLLLMISGISGYGQERIRELAREIWNAYPTECMVSHVHFVLFMLHSMERTFQSTKHTFQSMKCKFRSMKHRIYQGETTISSG